MFQKRGRFPPVEMTTAFPDLIYDFRIRGRCLCDVDQPVFVLVRRGHCDARSRFRVCFLSRHIELVRILVHVTTYAAAEFVQQTGVIEIVRP